MMQPQKDSDTILLPVTFDYNSGTQDSDKLKIILLLIAIGLLIFGTVILAVNPNLAIYTKFIAICGLWLLDFLFIEIVVLDGITMSNSYEEILENEGTLPYKYFWDIYSIDYKYPYICYYSNGLKGIFISFEKDVIIGKSRDVWFEHSEALSEAYKHLGSTNLSLVHIDTMTSVGNDPRIDGMIRNLDDCRSENIRFINMDMYNNLKFIMEDKFCCYDTYLFLSGGSEDSLWEDVKNLLPYFLSGNYTGYSVLDTIGIRDCASNLYNLTNFSAIQACNSLFKSSAFSGIYPLNLIKPDGSVEILGKSSLEKQQEAYNIERDKALRRSNKGKSFNSGTSPSDISDLKKETKPSKRKEVKNQSKDSLDLF